MRDLTSGGIHVSQALVPSFSPMKIFIDIFTKDELISDSYLPKAPYDMAELLDVAFEVESRKIAKGNEDFGISANVDEDAEEGAVGDSGPDVEQVIDVVDKFGLQEQYFDKKDFMVYIKKYMKEVCDMLEKSKPERVNAFKAGCATLIKKVVSEFSDCTIYTGKESSDAFSEFKAMPIIAHYVGEEVTPRFIFFKDAMIEEKC